LIDLTASKTGLDRALSFADHPFSLCEKYGYSVVLHEDVKRNRGYNNLWSPQRCTVVYIGTVAIGLTIIEMSEEVEVRYVNGEYVRERDYAPPRRGRHALNDTWTTTKDFPRIG
jgi:hypothetical protein